MAPTKKHKSSSMTIPQLRKAFDHIESFSVGLLRREKDSTKRRKAFQEEWMKVFHRAVDDKAADAYLQFESKKAKKGGKTRKQRGGAALSGAPLDYSTRPGIYGVYGTFPEYISAGFSTFGDATNKMAIQEGCNSAAEAAKFQPPYTGFGAPSLMSQKGGKSRRHKGKAKTRKGKSKTRKQQRRQRGGAPSWGEFASAISLRPITAAAPPSMLHNTMMEWKGSEPVPSSAPNTGAPPYQPYKPITTTTTAGVISRDLATEI
jgi:hypothetical protein